eukprot:scaffold7929_cov106-Isochrysis_galbana.AAC.1
MAPLQAPRLSHRGQAGATCRCAAQPQGPGRGYLPVCESVTGAMRGLPAGMRVSHGHSGPFVSLRGDARLPAGPWLNHMGAAGHSSACGLVTRAQRVTARQRLLPWGAADPGRRGTQGQSHALTSFLKHMLWRAL